MKKRILILVAILLCLGFSSVVLASSKKITLVRDKTVIVEGEKVQLSGRISTKKKNIVVKLYKSTKKKGKYVYKNKVKTKKFGNYHFHVTPKSTKYYKTKYVVNDKIISSEPKKVKVGTDPVLRNLMLDIDSYNPITSRAGAFLFGTFNSEIFLGFGQLVEGVGGDKMMPAFEYRPEPNVDVYAASYGIVGEVEYQAESDDYSILINTTSSYSPVYLDYDHVKNPQVSVRQVVQVGTKLGTPGTWTEGLGRTELQINEAAVDRVYSHCPFDYFEPKLKDEYQQKVTNLMDDWEDYKGNSNIYNQGAMVAPGCLYHKTEEINGEVLPVN